MQRRKKMTFLEACRAEWEREFGHRRLSSMTYFMIAGVCFVVFGFAAVNVMEIAETTAATIAAQ